MLTKVHPLKKWSTEQLNETYDKSCNLNRGFKEYLKNRDNSLNSIFSSDYPIDILMFFNFQPCIN